MTSFYPLVIALCLTRFLALVIKFGLNESGRFLNFARRLQNAAIITMAKRLVTQNSERNENCNLS